jgi:hypothetical protein
MRWIITGLLLLTLTVPATAGNVSNPPVVPRLGGAPTVTACGVSPAVVGFDSAGMITVGSGVIATCTLNFSTTQATAPLVMSPTRSSRTWRSTPP